MNKKNRITDYEPAYLHKPTKEDFEKARKCVERIRKQIKDKNIPYMSAEQIADLLKDRDMNEK